MSTGAQKFRDLLARGDMIIAPGVYDGYSARLVEAAGFEMAATTGAGISNSLLGIDDIGVMGLSENVNHCRMLARTLSIPLTADADTGYGNPMNVHYTVQMFEEAGLAGINIEDQVHPKRCGHMPGKEVIPLVEGVKKIEAACLARKDDAFARGPMRWRSKASKAPRAACAPMPRRAPISFSPTRCAARSRSSASSMPPAFP